MSIYMSRAELEEISEGLITAYANKFSNRVIQSIDIEHFITEFLMLRIEYASFAEDDAGRIGFLADGATPLLVHQDGKIIPFVFPKDTIVLDKFFLAEKEQGISGRAMRDVRSRMKNELEYQVNEKQENSIRLKE